MCKHAAHGLPVVTAPSPNAVPTVMVCQLQTSLRMTYNKRKLVVKLHFLASKPDSIHRVLRAQKAHIPHVIARLATLCSTVTPFQIDSSELAQACRSKHVSAGRFRSNGFLLENGLPIQVRSESHSRHLVTILTGMYIYTNVPCLYTAS